VKGTLGALLLEGADTVKLFNETIKVRARIVKLEGTSSHADRDHLLSWIKSIPTPTRVFVTHGEDSVAELFAKTLDRAHKIPAVAPYNGAVYDLINNDCIYVGNTSKKENTRRQEESERFNTSTVYGALKQTASEFHKLIPTLEGRANRELRELTKELRALIAKYK
ncbi:MAG: MBL fold metallo-hydrolase, partial [Clostridia bacterium]|nr:MBL fold metallo-hydrolase [Clostridia bacterium]